MSSEAPRAPLRIVFFGLPLAAVLLAGDGHDIALASFSFTTSPGLRRARRVLGEDRILVKPRAQDPALAERVQHLAPDLVVSWFWTTRLSMTVIRAARFGGIGAHPSLLPRHRGPDPLHWTLLLGDADAGVTVHRLEAEYDTGEILSQERLRIDPAWDTWLLARALDRPSLRLLRATVARFARGEAVAGTPQDPAQATEAPFPSPEAAPIRWAWSTERVLRHIRAFAPEPGAWTEVGGKELVVLKAAPGTGYPGALAPGEGVVVGERALVGTRDGAIELLGGTIDGDPAGPEAIAALFRSRASLG